MSPQALCSRRFNTREDATDGRRRYDVILDIGGNRRLLQLRRALTPRGRLVIVGGETDGRLLGGSDRQIRATLLSPFIGQTLRTFVVSENATDLSALRVLIEAGTVSAAVDRTYRLTEVPAAIRQMLDGRVRGKLVVSVAPLPTLGTHRARHDREPILHRLRVEMPSAESMRPGAAGAVVGSVMHSDRSAGTSVALGPAPGASEIGA
jgi:hypothetical protein